MERGNYMAVIDYDDEIVQSRDEKLVEIMSDMDAESRDQKFNCLLQEQLRVALASSNGPFGEVVENTPSVSKKRVKNKYSFPQVRLAV